MIIDEARAIDLRNRLPCRSEADVREEAREH